MKSDIAFSPSVKAEQTRLGSREAMQRQMAEQDWPDRISDNLAAFLAQRDSFYMATANAEGQPYIQHRGGPRGFLKPMGPATLAFADFSGNRQYISLGNLAENPRVTLFLMDYANSSRVKIWGRARVVEGDDALLTQLSDPAYSARVERAIVIDLHAWDVNCPQHIPELYDAALIRQATAKLSARIAELEAENAELRGWLGNNGTVPRG
ncbi:MAG: pyridoxamine 5'-phosphate oxidase family protein [Pseudomonadota bacterium]